MNLYENSVPIFLQTLGQMDGWLKKGVAFAKAKSFDNEVLLASRLAPDQYALTRQIQAACDAAKFGGARLAGKDAPAHPDTEKTVEELHARIAKCVEFLKSLDKKDFEGSDTRLVTLSFMPGKGVRGLHYLNGLAIPNFFFHATTTYAILRHIGVDIGKMDYLGMPTTEDI